MRLRDAVCSSNAIASAFTAVLMMLSPFSGNAQPQTAAARDLVQIESTDTLQELLPLAELGDRKAQFKLGQLYESGLETLQDHMEAVRLYRLAAEQGLASAQRALGWLYFRGVGVPEDTSEVIEWIARSAKQGDATALFYLGSIYEDVLRNDVLAHMWFNLSAAEGFREAASARDRISRRMSVEAVTEAQQLAKLCLASLFSDCGSPSYRARNIEAGDADPDPTTPTSPSTSSLPLVRLEAPSRTPTTPSEPSGQETSTPKGPPLTGAQVDAVRLGIQKCWRLDLVRVLPNYEDLIVVMTVRLDPSGKMIGRAEDVRLFQPPRDVRWRAAIDAARRALERAAREGFKLPAASYGRWQEINVTFDPQIGVLM